MSEGSPELDFDILGPVDPIEIKNICDLFLDVSDPADPIDIENIYKNVYSEIRDKVSDAGLFEWTMYRFVVKGKNERATIRKRAAGGDVHLEDGFVLSVGDADREKLTWSRLSACLLFDDCMNNSSADDATAKPPSGYDPATKTFVATGNAATARTLRDMAKYVPSMSTAIPWDDIAERLPSESMRWTLLDRVRFACGPGFNFVWRIYQAENRGAENLLEAGFAFLIGAFYLDLAGMNARRRRSSKKPLAAEEAFETILTLDGTFEGLLTNCANLEPPWNLKDVPEDILREALMTPLTTVLTRAAKRRLKASKKRDRRLIRSIKNGAADSDPLVQVLKAILDLETRLTQGDS